MYLYIYLYENIFLNPSASRSTRVGNNGPSTPFLNRPSVCMDLYVCECICICLYKYIHIHMQILAQVVRDEHETQLPVETVLAQNACMYRCIYARIYTGVCVCIYTHVYSDPSADRVR